MPEMGPYDALVKIDACGICNSTDKKILQRKFVSSIPVPLVLGHESVGTVVEVGSKVSCFQVGQRVLRPGASYPPGSPYASAWGGFAEYGLVSDLAAWQADGREGQPPGMSSKQQVIPSRARSRAGHGDHHAQGGPVRLARRGQSTRTTWTAIVGTGPVARAFTFWAHWLGAPFLVVLWPPRALLPRFPGARRQQLCPRRRALLAGRRQTQRAGRL